jgi:hypothetical protein
MLRGEFIRGDGLVIPNNVTFAGAQKVLELALRNTDVGFYVGLCDGVYTPDLICQDLTEPTIGLHGYARLQLNRDSTDWPVEDSLNAQAYLESKNLVWAATGGNFSSAITRMFIAFTATNVGANDPVFALSAALPDSIIITPTTDSSDRTFKYRLYLR